jgi:hypothetical protein
MERGRVGRSYLKLQPGRDRQVEQKGKRMPNAETEQAAPKKPISVSKMDIEALKDYTDQMAKFASGKGVVAVRICECCVKIAD